MNKQEFLQKIEENTIKDLEVLKAKNADYSGEEDPFLNFKGVEQWGICSAEEGIMVRLSDKMQRINNLLKREAMVTDEKMEDTLSDARNYLNILQVLLYSKK